MRVLIWNKVRLWVLLFYSERLCQLLSINRKELESESDRVTHKVL